MEQAYALTPKKYSREWMYECQQLIRDQKAELQNKEQLIQQLNQEIQQERKKGQQLSQNVAQLKQLNQRLEGQVKSTRDERVLKQTELSRVNINLQEKLEMLSKEVQKKQNLIDELQLKNEQLRSKHIEAQYRIKSMENERSMKDSHSQMQSEQLKTEVARLRGTLQSQIKTHTRQMSEVKAVNSQLRQQLETIEQDYQRIQDEDRQEWMMTRLNRVSPPATKKLSRVTQAQSTEKPVKRRRSPTRANPESLGHSLNEIKKEIALRCDKIEQTREELMMGRVNQTINNISCLLEEVAGRTQKQDSFTD